MLTYQNASRSLASQPARQATASAKLFRAHFRRRFSTFVIRQRSKGMQNPTKFRLNCTFKKYQEYPDDFRRGLKNHTRLHEPSEPFSDSSPTEILPPCVKKHAKIDYFPDTRFRCQTFKISIRTQASAQKACKHIYHLSYPHSFFARSLGI